MITERAYHDFARLSDVEAELFLKAVALLNAAYEQWVGAGHTGTPSVWPRRSRVKPLEGTPHVFELTWNFSGPDGRATFVFVTVDGEPAIQWRRIGGHDIFSDP